MKVTFCGGMSLRPTLLTKDQTNHFVLDLMSHHVTTLPANVQVLLFNNGDRLADHLRGLLGPWDTVLLSKEPSDDDGNPTS